MPRLSFEEAVAEVVKRDPRFPPDAYAFLRDALDHTIRSVRRDEESGEDRHVNGRQLLEGFRDHAIREFGPMVPVVLNDWGIATTEDVGQMVFNLIGVGVFGKSEEDSIEDFRDVFDFQVAFVEPFLSKSRLLPGGEAASSDRLGGEASGRREAQDDSPPPAPSIRRNPEKSENGQENH